MNYVKIRVTAEDCKFDNLAASKGAVVEGIKAPTADIAVRRKLCVILGDSEYTEPKIIYTEPKRKASSSKTPAPKKTKEQEAPPATS